MNQRGFAFLPFLLANWQLIAIGLLALTVFGYYKHCEQVKTRNEVILASLKVQADAAEKAAREKERVDAKRVQDAVTERDRAIARLRDSARPSKLSPSPTAPAGSSQVCIGAEAYNAAFKRFAERVQRGMDGVNGLALEGDEAQLDAETLLKAWPR